MTEASVQERTEFVSASDGTPLWYRVATPVQQQRGDSTAIVLCDGILCDGFVWKYLRPALLDHWAVIHWNYRGHGQSGAPRDMSHVGIVHHADDLWRVVDAAGFRRAVLVGHSMGTQVCLEGFRASRERTAGLVLVCGSYGLITRTFHGTDALSRVLPAVLRLEQKHPELFRFLVSLTPRRLAVAAARFMGEVDPIRTRTEDMLPYFEHLASMDPSVFLPMIHAAGEHSAEDLLREVNVPTLVVAAARDSFTPPRLAQQMADHIRGSRYLCVAGGSHSVPIEQPQYVNQNITRFLEEAVAVH